MVIVHFTFSQSQYGNYAHYYMHTLAANQQGYEHAKSVAIYALAKIRVSDQSVAIHNRKEQQKSQASWASHNNRMRANQRNFDGYQKAQADLSSVGDIYFEGWKPSRVPSKLRKKDEFVNETEKAFADDPNDSPEDCVRAVLKLLSAHIPVGEIDDVKNLMPTEIRELWS